MFVAPALGEAHAGGPILSLSQLEGANIHSTLVIELQTKQATGSERPATAEIEWTVAFRTGGKISWSYQPVIRTGRGDQKGATIAGSIPVWTRLGVQKTVMPCGNSGMGN